MNINVASLSSRTIWCRRRFDGRKGEMVITTHTNAHRVLHGTISSHSVAVVAHDFWSCRFLVSCDLSLMPIYCHAWFHVTRFHVMFDLKSYTISDHVDFTSHMISGHARFQVMPTACIDWFTIYRTSTISGRGLSLLIEILIIAFSLGM